MDGNGRALDNIAIERFWRTIKLGEIYLKEYQSVQEAKDGISSYINKYNSFRSHTAHGIKPLMKYKELQLKTNKEIVIAVLTTGFIIKYMIVFSYLKRSLKKLMNHTRLSKSIARLKSTAKLWFEKCPEN